FPINMKVNNNKQIEVNDNEEIFLTTDELNTNLYTQVITEVDRYFNENTVNKLLTDQEIVDLVTPAEDTDPDSSEKEK
ncbi:16252_t:CDS:1, partial [Dentiscutata heterogama]